MTTRYKAFIVTLGEDIRDDEAESTVTALRMVRGVIGVEPVPATYDDYVPRLRAATELEAKISQVFRDFR